MSLRFFRLFRDVQPDFQQVNAVLGGDFHRAAVLADNVLHTGCAKAVAPSVGLSRLRQVVFELDFALVVCLLYTSDAADE